jgi:septum formation protein
MKIYLASGSRRRIELLQWMGLEFEVIDHGFDERSVKIRSAKDLVAELVLEKAYAGAKQARGLVIGSDLIVDLEGEQLGKPKDKRSAQQMLKKLRNRVHLVYCGVAVIKTDTGEVVMSVDQTKVKMKNYSDEIIDRYIKEFAVLDKGGSYSIRYELKGFGSLVRGLEGSFTTILGLPLHYLENLLQEFGARPKKDWRKKCLEETGYEY